MADNTYNRNEWGVKNSVSFVSMSFQVMTKLSRSHLENNETIVRIFFTCLEFLKLNDFINTSSF